MWFDMPARPHPHHLQVIVLIHFRVLQFIFHSALNLLAKCVDGFDEVAVGDCFRKQTHRWRFGEKVHDREAVDAFLEPTQMVVLNNGLLSEFFPQNCHPRDQSLLLVWCYKIMYETVESHTVFMTLGRSSVDKQFVGWYKPTLYGSHLIFKEESRGDFDEKET